MDEGSESLITPIEGVDLGDEGFDGGLVRLVEGRRDRLP
jgi:hypothetical protein